MVDKVTREQLKEKVEMASPLPWKADGVTIKTTCPKRLGIICDFKARKYLNQAMRDQHLIIAAVNALPELLDSLQRAEARVQELKQRLAVVAKASYQLGGESGACQHEFGGGPCRYDDHGDCTKCWNDYLTGAEAPIQEGAPHCFIADGSGKCIGYSAHNDDEPIDMCKACHKSATERDEP